jgi:hypothetical protein
MADVIGKPFEKGVSGNPGGRKPIPPEIKEMARAASVEAIERAIYWMRSEDSAASLKAIQLITERAYGKPAQPINGDGNGGQIPVGIEVRFIRPGEA